MISSNNVLELNMPERGSPCIVKFVNMFVNMPIEFLLQQDREEVFLYSIDLS